MGNSATQSLVSLCPTEFYVGQSFDDRYEVDEENCIGTGKFSVVHLCWSKSEPERRCALKVIDTRNGDAVSLGRIREEINVLMVLGKNEHITSLLNHDDSLPNCIRLVMELCEGGELYDRIQQKHSYPEAEAKICMRNLLEGVAYVHSKGIMHRDLKPENILLSSRISNTDVKISDFGLSKISRNFPERLPRATSICGSDFYLAPEVIRQEEYGREIDVWALGVIVYVLLSGSLPFFHNTLHKLYRKIVERDLAFPVESWKQVSKGGMDFVLRMLQVRPGDRPTSEAGLNHPWLRLTEGRADSSSFLTNSTSSTELQGFGSQQAMHPLEHAHKVNAEASRMQTNGRSNPS